jgi:uncharacterized protein (TIGR00661 family)
MSATPKPKQKVLVAPLDWGLGHATRCIVIIRELIAAGCEVFIATDGNQKKLLEAEFPQAIFLPLKGYNVVYGTTKFSLAFRIFFQVPKIIKAIENEHRWLNKIVEEHKIDVVISDNRYGLYHKKAHSVFITHQLRIKTPLGKVAEDFLQKLNYKYINKFDECWVPDTADEQSLAGELSHPKTKPTIGLTYIGPLCRFTPENSDIETHYILILLSGPEPQRTLLEKKLLIQLNDFKQPTFFIRGLPGDAPLPKVPHHVFILNHLATFALQKAIQQAIFVVSRCGYTTLMELTVLRKRCILIPTPGQTEQEYLAKHVMEQKMAMSIPQHKFKLSNAIELAELFNYKLIERSYENNIPRIVNKLLHKVDHSKDR